MHPIPPQRVSAYIDAKWKSSQYWGKLLLGSDVLYWGIRGGTVSWNPKTGEIINSKREVVATIVKD